MTNTDYSGNVVEAVNTSSYWRIPRMPYEFSNLSAADMAQEADRVKKELERQLYGALLKMGENPATYDTAAHTVPEDEFAVNYAIKVDVARILSNLAFINNL